MLICANKQMMPIIEKLNYWNKCYDEGNPIVSDKEYDDLYFKLQELEKESGLVLSNSPTFKINYDIKTELNKVRHNHPMLSLAKTKDWNEFVNYFDKDKLVIAMPKLDGLTCSLKYMNGKLVSAETRGNGDVGEDILHNIMHVANVPREIRYKKELVIDGEVICTYKDFEKFSDQYANPRNFAAGSIRLLDSAESAKRNLTFVAWYVPFGSPNKDFTMQLEHIQQLGFTCVPWLMTLHDQTVECVKLEAQVRGYPIDGLVARYEDTEYGESLGRTGHHRKDGFAFKFYDEEYETTLKTIEWSMGRTGVLTPVAVFEPVDTGDSTVERASLHNLSVMKSLLGAPYTGQKIKIAKMNEIIPQVVWGDIKEDGWATIGTCPVCGAPTIIKDNEGVAQLYCSNDECSGKLINKLDHYCSKNGLDIKGLSEQTLEKLIEWGWVNSISDLYHLSELHQNEWIKKPGFGVSSVGNILYSIQANSYIEEPWRLISALGIPLIGVSASKDLAKAYSIDEFICNAKEGYDFTELDGFGPEMNAAIQNFDYTEIEYLLDNGYVEVPEQQSQDNDNEQTCLGMTVVITGSLNNYPNREALVNDIEARGGTVSGSVSKKTTVLINNDITSTSGKNAKAKALSVPIMTEEEFIDSYLK